MQQIPQPIPPPVGGYTMPVQQVPPYILQSAASYQLDNFLAMYQPVMTNPLAIIGLTLAVIVGDIFLAVVIYNVGFILYLLIILPIVAIVYAIIGLVYSNLRVYVFKNGLVRAKGRQMEVIRWDNVESVWLRATRSRYGNTSYTYTIRRRDGLSFKFTNVLKNVAVLGQNMQREVTLLHMPMAISAYNSGNTAGFGPLNVSLQGLSNGSEMLPWNMVQSVEMKQGYIIVRKVGKATRWAYVRVSKVPNYTVFMGLVNYARSQQR